MIKKALLPTVPGNDCSGHLTGTFFSSKWSRLLSHNHHHFKRDFYVNDVIVRHLVQDQNRYCCYINLDLLGIWNSDHKGAIKRALLNLWTITWLLKGLTGYWDDNGHPLPRQRTVQYSSEVPTQPARTTEEDLTLWLILNWLPENETIKVDCCKDYLLITEG
jgi:hypothetical protein